MANDAKFNFYLNRQGPRGQKGEKGDQGFSPSITVNTNTADEYTLLIQNEYNNFVTDNIRPTYDDRGGTYVRVDRANNVQYFGSADIATTANYGEVKLAQASDLASTVDVGNSNVITVELLKTWFDGQLADNLVTTTNNVTIQGQKVFATPTRFMDTVRVGNRLMVTQDDTGTITFDSGEDGTLIGTHLTSTGDASFSQNVTVDGIATIEGGLNVAGNAVISSPQLGNTTISEDLTTKADINIQGQKVHLQHANPTMYLKNVGGTNEIEIFRGLFTAGNPSPADNYLHVGHSQLQLNLTGKAIKANGKDVATTDTVEAIQSDLNIAKQDIIEAQGDIDNLQMNKQNKLTAGTGITIDADNVISATGGVADLPIASSTTLGGIKVGENLTISEDGTLSATGGGSGTTIDDSTTSSTSTWSSSKINSEINTVANEVVQVQGDVTTLSGKVTVVEGKTTDLESTVANKQDKLTAISPVNIATKVLSPTEGWIVSSSSMQSRYKEQVANYSESLYGDGTTMHLTSDSEYPIKSYIAMPYTVGQVIKYKHNYSNYTQTTLVLGDIMDGKIYPVLINSATGDYRPQYTTALFDGTQELTKEVMTNGINYSSEYRDGPYNQAFINEATFGWLQNTGTSLVWHVFTPRNSNNGDYGYVTYTSFNGYAIDDLVGKIKYAIILAGNTSLAYTPDQFGVYENTLSSYSNISDYQALSPNLFDLSKNEVQTQISALPATTSSLGVVKPDGTTITITEDGTISAVGGGGVTYTAEAPLSISADNVISIDTTNLGGTTLKKDASTIDYALDLTANGTVGSTSKAARAESNESRHDAYMAFSGHNPSDAISTLWGPSSRKANSWVELYVPEGIIPASAAWTYGSTGEILPAVELVASNDGSSYTSLGSVEGISTVTGSMTFNTTDSYKYLRFKFRDACVTSAWGKFGLTSLKVKSSEMTTYTELFIGDSIDVTNGTMNVNLDEIDIELNNPYSLFDSKYSDHELNNLSWLKSKGQWNAKAVYPSAYDELLREYNSPDRLATFNKDAFEVVGNPTITADGIASGFSSSNYPKADVSITPVNRLVIKSRIIYNTSGNTSPYPQAKIFCGTNYNGWRLTTNYGDNIQFASTDLGNIYLNIGIMADGDIIDTELIITTTSVTINAIHNGAKFTKTELKNVTFGLIPNFAFGNAFNGSDYFFTGSIDLKQCSITVDGVKVFSGANSKVKLSTETYTDYDFVLNTAEETFRLPLKNHTADDSIEGLTLYYYVGETVQNANLIDAGRIGEQLAGKVDSTNTQWAVSACMPDYSARVDVSSYNSSTNQFTAPVAGWLIGGKATTCLIYINDYNTADRSSSSGAGSISVTLPMSKGDKYYRSGDINRMVFCPAKGAQ